MRVGLHFKQIDRPGVRKDWVPFLLIDGALPPKDSCLIDSKAAFDHEIREIRGGSNRAREVFIVTGRDAAEMIARLRQKDWHAVSIISHLRGEAWAVGSIYGSIRFDGGVDGGMPEIVDLRVDGKRIEFAPGLASSVRGIVPLPPGLSRTIDLSCTIDAKLAADVAADTILQDEGYDLMARQVRGRLLSMPQARHAAPGRIDLEDAVAAAVDLAEEMEGSRRLNALIETALREAAAGEAGAEVAPDGDAPEPA
ncbi:hypothetical protein LAZ40_02280 [Cereibacter sphaeroides]|uniref:hypothetical protein n=1 Tax=Cereibacter sphaeroides TaxID=1063 RepID=UPI001F3D9C96|nr:hypothetical protein [Cereibacter sphaeroides]MCE6957885.1 hypothetical protein [Cereibacter sphaeroides]MCE6971854.1 hypothetical protein [Cereibacter sphaeroides]